MKRISIWGWLCLLQADELPANQQCMRRIDGKSCCGQRQDLNAQGEANHCAERDGAWRDESEPQSTKSEDLMFESETLEFGERHRNFAPYPNLSLNIGIRSTPKWVPVSVAIFGILLQCSFFGYATVVTFYRPRWYQNKRSPDIWAFALATLGTVMVVFGMVLCAFLVERKSQERDFIDNAHPFSGNPKARPCDFSTCLKKC